MLIVVRLLPTDEWREFSFPSSSTILEVKIRALQHFGILPAVIPAAAPATSGRPRTATTAGEKSRGSSIKANRRSSLLGTGDTGNGSSVATQLGASEELIKAAETLGRYCFLNVCNGNYVDDNKTLGTACVMYDLLVLQQRRKALILPLDGFCYPYLRLSCPIQSSNDSAPSHSLLGIDEETNEFKLYKPYTLTVFNNQLWLHKFQNDSHYLCYQLRDLPCTVSPASFAMCSGSRSILQMTMADGTRLRIRTAKEEDWESLLMCLGPGTTIPSFDRRAHMSWREQVFRRAQRSNQGLLPPPVDTNERPSTPEARFTQPVDPNLSPSSRKLRNKVSKDTGLAGASHAHRLAMKRSKTDLPGLQPSAEINPPQIPRRARSFSTPPLQLPVLNDAPVFVSGSIPMPTFDIGLQNPNLQLAEIASSPETGSAKPFHSRYASAASAETHASTEIYEDSGHGHAETISDKKRDSSPELPRLMARDTRRPAQERQFRRWNDPDSDELDEY